MFAFVGKIGRWGINKVKQEGVTLLNLRDAKKNGQVLVDDAKRVLNPNRHREIRNETFQQAYARLELDEPTLERVYTNHRRRFYVATFFLIVAIVITMQMLFNGRWMLAGPGVAAIAVTLAQMFDASLRTYQIRQRTLVGPSEWWAASDQWWPGKFVSWEQMERENRRETRRRRRREEKPVKDVTTVDATAENGENDVVPTERRLNLRQPDKNARTPAER